MEMSGACLRSSWSATRPLTQSWSAALVNGRGVENPNLVGSRSSGIGIEGIQISHDRIKIEEP
ncbi:MAG: hypothetical protein ACI4EH_13450 [Oliverpabstia sp.]